MDYRSRTRTRIIARVEKHRPKFITSVDIDVDSGAWHKQRDITLIYHLEK